MARYRQICYTCLTDRGIGCECPDKRTIVLVFSEHGDVHAVVSQPPIQEAQET